MGELLSIQTLLKNGICRWLEGLRDDSIRETDRKEVNFEKKRRNGNNITEKARAYHFSIACHVSTEAHFYTSVFEPILPRPLAVWGRQKKVCKITGRKKPTKQNMHMFTATGLLEGSTKQNYRRTV